MQSSTASTRSSTPNAQATADAEGGRNQQFAAATGGSTTQQSETTEERSRTPHEILRSFSGRVKTAEFRILFGDSGTMIESVSV